MKETEKQKKSFAKLYKKPLKVTVIDKSEYESLFNLFTKYFDETKKKFFSILEIKN